MRYWVKMVVEVDVTLTTGASQEWLEANLERRYRQGLLDPLAELGKRMLHSGETVDDVKFSLNVKPAE
jgi:hypothetical protein